MGDEPLTHRRPTSGSLSLLTRAPSNHNAHTPRDPRLRPNTAPVSTERAKLSGGGGGDGRHPEDDSTQ